MLLLHKSFYSKHSFITLCQRCDISLQLSISLSNSIERETGVYEVEGLVMEGTWSHKPNVEISPSCPRCGSSNTKFCYYNNYSLTQPRYFCKGCRRYWTKGGSLRNVPIGGGCRKNRRGKSVRLTTNGGLSKSLAYVGGATSENVSDGNCYGNKVNAFVESSTSSTLAHQQDGSHIDLALVYANFLNQQPETKAAGSFDIPELPEFDPSMEFSSMVSTNLDTRVPLPEENNNNNNNRLMGSLSFSNNLSAGAEAHLRDNDHIYYSSVFDSVHDHKHNYQHGIQLCSSHHETSNQVLPPLPSDQEIASQEILWLNSQMMVNHNVQAATQGPMLGPEAEDPTSLLFGNWSPFDFSSDDTFNKT